MTVSRMFAFDQYAGATADAIFGDWASKLNNYVLPYVTSVTTTYTAKTNDHTIEADATAGAFSINLPAASSCLGLTLNIIKVDASANAVTLDPNGAETVGGVATRALATQWAELTVQSNGTSWDVLSFVPFTSAGVLPTTAGGTGLSSYAAGDMLYYASGAAFSKLAIGAKYAFSQSTGAAPSWVASPLLLNALYLGGRNAADNATARLIGRNAAGNVSIDPDQWGTIFGNQLFGINGLVGTPSYSFTTDTLSGMYLYGASQVAIACGGVLAMYISAAVVQFPGYFSIGSPSFLGTPSAGEVIIPKSVWYKSTNNAGNTQRKLMRINGATDGVEIDGDAVGVLLGGSETVTDFVAAGGLVSFNKSPTTSQTIPAGYSCVVAGTLTIASGKSITIGLNATLALVA